MNATHPTSPATIRVLPPEIQGSGAFDGGRITEIKPIPFPQESGGLRAIGPLFYWAWASAKGDGVIPMHPHQGFEIISYALEGEIGHSDSLGTKSRIGKGGAQVMQTGSGVSHQEEMFGERTEFFQIWFEPHLQEAVARPPTYAEFSDADFPRTTSDGVEWKSIIGGDNGPVQLVADVRMIDVTVEPGKSVELPIGKGRVLASMTVEGSGSWQDSAGGSESPISRRDFTLIENGGGAIEVKAGDNGLRLVAIDVPAEPDYPLYGR